MSSDFASNAHNTTGSMVPDVTSAAMTASGAVASTEVTAYGDADAHALQLLMENITASKHARVNADRSMTVILDNDVTTEQLYRLHVAGQAQIASSPFEADQRSVRWACVRFHPQSDGAMGKPAEYGLMLQEALRTSNMESYVEVTSEGEAHVWVFFETPAPAEKIRQALNYVLTDFGFPGAEIVPTCDSSQAGADGEAFSGGMVCAPFWGVGSGVNGERTGFIDAERQQIPLPFSVQKISLTLLDNLTPKGGKKDAISVTPEPKEDRSFAGFMRELVSQFDGFRDMTGTPYVRLNKSPCPPFQVGSRELITHVNQLLLDKQDRMMTEREESVMAARFHVLVARAQKQEAVSTRTTSVGGKVLIDRCDNDNRLVEITPEGFSPVSAGAAAFRRTENMLPMPIPVGGGNLEALLGSVLHCDKDTIRIFIIWLLSALNPIPNAGYLMLILKAAAGSGKTTIMRMLTSLIDPSTKVVRAIPKTERDLAVVAHSSFVVSLDNISGMPQSVSDLLCIMAYGGIYEKRKNGRDSESVVIPIRNPVIMTSIADVGEGKDLLSRAAVVELPPITAKTRRNPAQMQAEFDEKLPQILGALYDTVAAGMARLPATHLDEMPRMADCALFATACEEKLGWEPGTACKLLLESNSCSMLDALYEDNFALALCEAAVLGQELEMDAATLHKHLTEMFLDQSRGAGWPKTPRVMAQRIADLSPVLQQAGVVIGKRRSNGKKLISITALPAAIERFMPVVSE